MKIEKLKIYQKVSDLRDWLFPILDHFPRRERFALCTRIKHTVYDIVEAVIRIALGDEATKNALEADVKLQMLKFLIAEAHARKYLSHKKYAYFSELALEIGKMIGGLRKRLRGGGG